MPENTSHNDLTTSIEIEFLLEGIFRRYGYDFRSYSPAHIKRRLINKMKQNKFRSLSEMQHHVLHDKNFFNSLLKDLSINVTEMFRDPAFYVALRKEVIPILKTYPFIKVWHAGCASGEEVYSFAILLKEEGIYDRTQIYATDFNNNILEVARKGIYPVDRIKEYTVNYQKAGGKYSFTDYYLAKYNSAIIDQALKKNIVFAEHNLVTDTVFAEMHVIICRNVLIYFNRDLQNKVIRLFNESLVHGGFLGLGTKETIQFSNYNAQYTDVNKELKIYKKKVNE